ncbi:SIR2 family protein [Kordiimonas sp.]|uniref:SIR2 family protein n=1 Tax=Kordiimonas sp. TaxID=1970157 RepID=UPI003A9132AE
METFKYLRSAIRRQPNLAKWLCHIIQRRDGKQLSLMLGAGASTDAGIPMWEELVERISHELSDFRETYSGIVECSPNKMAAAYRTQLLFQQFWSTRDEYSGTSDFADLEHKNAWLDIVRRGLYKDIADTDDIEAVISNHPYLAELANLAFQCPHVLTLNFDDLLSLAMRHLLENDGSRKHMDDRKAPDVRWLPEQLPTRGRTTIYHLNGLLSFHRGKKRSGDLVFTESAFADVLVDANSPSAERSLSYFSESTFLLLGLSLEDVSLKNLLRACRNRHPAHPHYFIHWMPNAEALTEGYLSHVFATNLEVYNLVTIFLTTEEIHEFLKFVAYTRNTSEDRSMIRSELQDLGHDSPCQRYYIVGPVGAGKTTLIENLRSFETFEEWTGNPPSAMYREHTSLSALERNKIDNWVSKQIRRKNEFMRNADVGFYFMDRGPLDALAFSKTAEEVAEKADKILNGIGNGRRLEEGEVIFLSALPKELIRRNLGRGRLKKNDDEYLRIQSEDLRETYQVSPEKIRYTDRANAKEIARQIMIECLTGDYTPTKMHDLIENKAHGSS